MNNLQNLQSNFKRYLFEQDNDIASYILSTENFNNDSRLAIYGNAYRSRLTEALANDYPAVNFLIGENDFCTLSQAYIKAHPSSNYSLRWFGQRFAPFLANHKIYSRPTYLAELANFEWAFVSAFDAPNADVLAIKNAAMIPPEAWPKLQMILHPSLYLVTCSWNCLSVWLSMKNNTVVPMPKQLDSKVSYLIWRQGLNTKYRSLESDEAIALEIVKKGADFSELCAALSQELEIEDTALRAASLFKTWLTDGLIIRIDY